MKNNKLREMREKRLMTQAEVGTAVGVNAQTISNYENDRARPRFRVLRELCKLFDATPEQLFPEDADKAVPAA